MKKISTRLWPIVICFCLLLLLLLANEITQTVDAFSRQKSLRTVVIDAGHGGEDGGAAADDGVTESELNLAVSLRLRDLLRLCGAEVRMIRETDTAVYTEGDSIQEKKRSDLKNRVRMVNETSHAILVSIHQNHFGQSKYHGAQVFYAGTEKSEELALSTQQALRQTLDPQNRRMCKRSDSVYLMEQIRCPGILVECGFLSNPEESRMLRQSGYQQRLAAAICSAVCGFMSEERTQNEV